MDDPRDERAFASLEFTDYRGRGSHGLKRDEIGLTREFDGESIQVKVEMPYQWICDRRQKKNADNSLNLTVKILKKKNGKELAFDISASSVITIDDMWITLPTDEDKYPRPEHLCVGDESCLHTGLKEYLRVRGIDESATDFLRKYMRWKWKWKWKNQPMIVLKNLKKFLEN